jgi:hypothetical protein
MPIPKPLKSEKITTKSERIVCFYVCNLIFFSHRKINFRSLRVKTSKRFLNLSKQLRKKFNGEKLQENKVKYMILEMIKYSVQA